MIESLILIFHRLIDEVDTRHYRFLYYKFNLNSRLTGIIGARGVGKTTLMLQYIKNNLMSDQQTFYFSADHIYFNTTSIYAFIEEMVLTQGIKIFFIDEIHKYKNWNQELKNIYDAFPKLKIVFSGSSSMELVHGSYDLSRRAKLYHLPGMSFREYINFSTNSEIDSITFEDLIANSQKYDSSIMRIDKIKGLFHEYLRQGFYPFYNEDHLSYYEKLLNIINKTIYEDIANFYNLKTENLHYFKKLMNYLASIPPGEVNTHNLAKNTGIDDKTVLGYLDSLNKTGLVNLIYPAEPGHSGMRRPEKILLNNTNLQYALENHMGASSIEIGTIRELFFVQTILGSGKEIFHNKHGDYEVDKYIFEIGGKNKTRRSNGGEKNYILIKDDILISRRGEIPLIYFGFIY